MRAHTEPSDIIKWTISPTPVAYDLAVRCMEQWAAAIALGDAPEGIWLLEHPPLYTAGTSARTDDLLQPHRFPVHISGRGGQYTYHGPGQRIVYVLLDVRRRFAGDVRAFVTALEAWIVDVLAEFGINGILRPGLVGVWIAHAGGCEPQKIAALGVRITRGISLHGLSINVSPDLGHFSGIVPCGQADAGITSLAALGSPATMADVDAALRRQFERRFGWYLTPHEETAIAEKATPGPVVTEPGGNLKVSNDR